MIREAWNSVRAVPKQVVQGENFRKQCFEGFICKFWRFTSEIIVSFTNCNNLTTFGGNPVKISCARYIDYFMESARVRYLRTSCFCIRKLVRKYRTKHFPCCNLFILYLLTFFNPNQTFTLH